MTPSIKPFETDTFALSTGRRFVAGLAVTCSALGLVLVLVAILTSHDPPITPPILFRMYGSLVVLPYMVSRWILRSTRASLRIDDQFLAFKFSNKRIEVPLSAITKVEPWAIPLPEPGICLRLQSGARLTWGISGCNVDKVSMVLAPRGLAPSRAAALQFAVARAASDRPGWLHLFGKFPIFALTPALILFRAHQYIAYGGWWGQWNLYGPRAWFETFATYWAATTIYTLLYAGVLRVAEEILVWLLTQQAPESALAIRRRGEVMLLLAYYIGVPVMLALRFAPW